MVIALYMDGRGAVCPICRQSLVQREIGSLVDCLKCSSQVLPSKVAVAAVAAVERMR